MAKSIIEKKLAKKRAGERKKKISQRNNGYTKTRAVLTSWPPKCRIIPVMLVRNKIDLD